MPLVASYFTRKYNKNIVLVFPSHLVEQSYKQFSKYTTILNNKPYYKCLDSDTLEDCLNGIVYSPPVGASPPKDIGFVNCGQKALNPIG